MNASTFAALAFAALSLAAPHSAHGQPPHYHFTAGETLRYLIQRDPYFADPKEAIETVTPDAEYRPPIVERLVETVRGVDTSGTATLHLMLTTEPGFEDETRPQTPVTRTVVVTETGRIVSVSGPALGGSPEEQDLLRGIVALSPALTERKDGLAVENLSGPISVTQTTSPDHDGTLLQTTEVTRSDHVVFNCHAGWLEREVTTLSVTLSLVMTGRGRRGSDDFGHVVPNAQVIQTLSIERQAN